MPGPTTFRFKHNRLRPEPIRFVRLNSEHARSDGKPVNRGHSGVGPGHRSRFLVLTKRSAVSGDENALPLDTRSIKRMRNLHEAADVFFVHSSASNLPQHVLTAVH